MAALNTHTVLLKIQEILEPAVSAVDSTVVVRLVDSGSKVTTNSPKVTLYPEPTTRDPGSTTLGGPPEYLAIQDINVALEVTNPGTEDAATLASSKLEALISAIVDALDADLTLDGEVDSLEIPLRNRAGATDATNYRMFGAVLIRTYKQE